MPLADAGRGQVCLIGQLPAVCQVVNALRFPACWLNRTNPWWARFQEHLHSRHSFVNLNPAERALLHDAYEVLAAILGAPVAAPGAVSVVSGLTKRTLDAKRRHGVSM